MNILNKLLLSGLLINFSVILVFGASNDASTDKLQNKLMHVGVKVGAKLAVYSATGSMLPVNLSGLAVKSFLNGKIVPVTEVVSDIAPCIAYSTFAKLSGSHIVGMIGVFAAREFFAEPQLIKQAITVVSDSAGIAKQFAKGNPRKSLAVVGLAAATACYKKMLLQAH